MPTKIATKHELINKFTKGLVKGSVNSFILTGRGGIGKTEAVLKTLAEMNLQENKHFKYINNYATPKRFYQILQEVNVLEKPKLLILDDFDIILKNKVVVGMLRSALWGDLTGRRKISWYSTTTQDSEEFYFNGKIIFLLNDLQIKDPLIKALISRGFFYNIQLTNLEILNLMSKRVEHPYPKIEFKERKKVFNFISTCGADSPKLTLRTLELGYNLYISSPNHYQYLLTETLK